MDFSAAVVDKAKRLLAEHRMTQVTTSNTRWIVDPAGYLVQCDYDPERNAMSWMSCTCPSGLHSDPGTARCSHAAAALLILRERYAGMPYTEPVEVTP
jgi:hypothetical protein